MTLHINGTAEAFEREISVAELIQRYRLTPERVAVEVNERLVRRTAFGEVTLRDGDRVEIVTFVGGG